MTQITLQNKIALISGASRGIGAAVARDFALAGADLALTARTTPALEALATEIRALGRKVLVISADLADPATPEAIVAATVQEFGRVDVVVNNAGISPIFKNAVDTTRAEWEEIFTLNMTVPFLVSQAAAKAMIAAGNGGSIIQMASVAAFLGGSRIAAYAATKAALVSATKSLALEWARYRIRVNAIAPGYVTTDMTAGMMSVPKYADAIRNSTPQGRLGEPDEISGIAVYLASDAASFATGQAFVIDGGISLG